MENPIIMDDLGVPSFSETLIYEDYWGAYPFFLPLNQPGLLRLITFLLGNDERRSDRGNLTGKVCCFQFP